MAYPVRIMAEMDEEWDSSSRAWFSSLKRGVERALRALGRLSVTECMMGQSLDCQDRELYYFDRLLAQALK